MNSYAVSFSQKNKNLSMPSLQDVSSFVSIDNIQVRVITIILIVLDGAISKGKMKGVK